MRYHDFIPYGCIVYIAFFRYMFNCEVRLRQGIHLQSKIAHKNSMWRKDLRHVGAITGLLNSPKQRWSMESCWWFFHVHLCRPLFEDSRPQLNWRADVCFFTPPRRPSKLPLWHRDPVRTPGEMTFFVVMEKHGKHTRRRQGKDSMTLDLHRSESRWRSPLPISLGLSWPRKQIATFWGVAPSTFRVIDLHETIFSPAQKKWRTGFHL